MHDLKRSHYENLIEAKLNSLIFIAVAEVPAMGGQSLGFGLVLSGK